MDDVHSRAGKKRKRNKHYAYKNYNIRRRPPWHLTMVHNVVLLLSGAVAIYFGLKATPAATRNFCVVFGALYGLLGVAGFVAGGPDYAFTIIPGALVLGTMDHLVHLTLGAIFLAVGWGWRGATATPPAH